MGIQERGMGEIGMQKGGEGGAVLRTSWIYGGEK